MASSSTKRIVVRTAVVAGAIAAVTGVTAASTLAATTYTVKAGSKTAGTQAYTGRTNQITFTDGDLELGCDAGTAKGVATLGPNVAARIATITATTWTTCTGPFGLVLEPVQSGTWSVNAIGATNTKGVTKAFVGNVNATVSNPDGQCTFTVKGSAPGNYNNTTGRLTLVSTTTGTRVLKVSGVDGCFGLINNGDIVGFAAAYTIKAGAAGLLNVKSN